MNSQITSYNESVENKNRNRLPIRMLKGAGLALVILTFMFLTMGESNTNNLRWMILPYLFVSVAGSLGGLVFHLLQPLSKKGTWFALLGTIMSVLAYLFLFVIAFIAGMNGPD